MTEKVPYRVDGVAPVDAVGVVTDDDNRVITVSRETQPVTFVRVETVYVIECEVCGKVGESRDPALADDRVLEHAQERWHG